MTILSSLKQKMMYCNKDSRSKPIKSSSVISQSSQISHKNKSSQVGRKALMLNQNPILSFTSFQSYLEDCNQNSFVRKQNEKLFRSQQKHKTQQDFNPKKQTYRSSQTKKHRFLTQQDYNQISPFQTDKQITFKHYKTGKSNRKAHSKSESSNYSLQKSSSFADRFLLQKLGVIQGWNHNENQDHKNNKNFNQSILKERFAQNKQNKRISSKNNYDMESPSKNFSKQILNQSMRKKSEKSSNKENVSQGFSVCQLRKRNEQEHDIIQSNPFQKTFKKSLYPISCLTQINELEQEILLSKRQDITNRNSQMLKNITYKQESNILRLKKEAQYLCNQQEEFRNKHSDSYENKQNLPKSKFMSIQLSDVSNSCNSKIFKPFVKFPSHTPNQSINKNIDDENMNNTANGYFEFKQKSTNMFKILQQMSPNHQNMLYESRAPCKPISNLKNYKKINGTQNDLKNASRNRQNFHNSIKQRKSKSAFNSICKNDKTFSNKQTPKINTSQFSSISQNEDQNKLLITIVNSFHSVKNSKPIKNKDNRNSLSLAKSIHASVNKEQNQCKRLYTSQSFHFENDSLNATANQMDISEFLINSNPKEYKFQQTVPISFGQSSQLQQNFLQRDSSGPLQNLNKLSQEIKKMTKISTPISLSTKYNKKNSNFHKSIKNQKPSLRSPSFCKMNSDIENLCISQLQGRQIHKLKKVNEMQK